MKDFLGFELPAPLLHALQRIKITEPTPIQQAAIPPALAGSDLLASAQTGTGKTIAYALPLLAKLLSSPQSSSLILAPTRELALQVAKTLGEILGAEIPLKIAVLIGGAPMGRQFSDLKRRPQLIIGTPGRIMDHLSRAA